jgi:hypothetical protein
MRCGGPTARQSTREANEDRADRQTDRRFTHQVMRLRMPRLTVHDNALLHHVRIICVFQKFADGQKKTARSDAVLSNSNNSGRRLKWEQLASGVCVCVLKSLALRFDGKQASL